MYIETCDRCEKQFTVQAGLHPTGEFGRPRCPHCLAARVELDKIEIERLRAENERLSEIVEFVDSWVSNPASSYSVHALDGLFGMTRDKIDSLVPVL